MVPIRCCQVISFNTYYDVSLSSSKDFEQALQRHYMSIDAQYIALPATALNSRNLQTFILSLGFFNCRLIIFCTYLNGDTKLSFTRAEYCTWHRHYYENIINKGCLVIYSFINIVYHLPPALYSNSNSNLLLGDRCLTAFQCNWTYA